MALLDSLFNPMAMAQLPEAVRLGLLNMQPPLSLASQGAHPVTGRPMLPAPNGMVATEESITVTHPRLNDGKPTNIPSIWGGHRPPFQPGTAQFEDWAVENALKSGEQFQPFNDIGSAVAAAKQRSAELGRSLSPSMLSPEMMGSPRSIEPHNPQAASPLDPRAFDRSTYSGGMASIPQGLMSPPNVSWPGETPPVVASSQPSPVGAPMQISPQAPQTMAQPSAPMQTRQGSGNPLQGVQEWLGRNQNALMAMGAGLAGGRGWGEGISKGITGAMQGRALDQAQGNQNQTYQMLTARGMEPEMARAVVSNPAVMQQVLLGMVPGVTKPIEVNGKLVDPKTYKVLADYSTPPQPSELEKRAAAAGLQPGTPEMREFMLRGGRNSDAPLSATDKKEIFKSEDAIPQLKSTIDALGRALEINDKTFSGYTAGIRGSIGTKLPGGGLLVDRNSALATEEWSKIMAPEALQAMANTLKGATTDFELRKFIEMLGDPSVDPAIRKSVIQRMLTLSERKLDIEQRRLNELRSSDYYKPGGGISTPAPGQTTPAAPSATTATEGWTDVGGGVRIRRLD